MSRKILTLCAIFALVASGTAFAGIDEDLMVIMSDVNAQLDAVGADVRVEMIEYFTAGDEVGRTVFFSNVGNKRLDFDFVPGDPRRAWSGPVVGGEDDITWVSDQVEGDAGVGFAATQAAIQAAMGTWEDAQCSNLPLTEVAGGEVGYLQFILTGGAQGGPPAADVVHAGFGTVVDALLPPPIIAATFTLQFVSGGNPTDIDNDGRGDVALREIYYTNNFAWGIGNNIDVETVVLHETGHALSQGHFGTVAQTPNGKFHFSPRAVMNAGYTGVLRNLTGTDNAGHCSNWGSWPSH